MLSAFKSHLFPGRSGTPEEDFISQSAPARSEGIFAVDCTYSRFPCVTLRLSFNGLSSSSVRRTAALSIRTVQCLLASAIEQRRLTAVAYHESLCIVAFPARPEASTVV